MDNLQRYKDRDIVELCIMHLKKKNIVLEALGAKA